MAGTARTAAAVVGALLLGGLSAYALLGYNRVELRVVPAASREFTRVTLPERCAPLFKPGAESLNSEWKICMNVEAE